MVLKMKNVLGFGLNHGGRRRKETHLGGLKGPLQLIVALGPAYEKTATEGGGFHTLNTPFMFLPRVTSVINN